MKIKLLTFTLLACSLASCENKTPSDKKQAVEFMNKGHEIVYKMGQKVGDYQKLLAQENVLYTYTYTTPDGKSDISREKYIFNGELSYGKYLKHERTLPNLVGEIEQGYDGEGFWLKHKGEIITDETALKRVAFNRPTNYYWFTMMQKILNPKLNYEHLGDTAIAYQHYDIVKITFNSNNDKPTDIYQLYINKETQLVDQFLFTVADFGMMETPNLMQLEYEEIDGLLIPTKRKYKKSTWAASVDSNEWIYVTWSNITFKNDINKEDFKKENNMRNTSTLQSKLDAKKEQFELKADANKKRAYKEGIESVENSKITITAKQVGDKAPNFTLTNALGKSVQLYDYLKKGKVVLTWYRGGWCPYCNLTLHELQGELPNFKANGATLIALTPELPDKSITTAEKNDLGFEVLSDLGNKIADEYGIVFKLTEEVAEMYNASFDMNGYNGDASNELPLAATYIIAENGEVLYAFLDADYRNRAEPSVLTEFLKSL